MEDIMVPDSSSKKNSGVLDDTNDPPSLRWSDALDWINTRYPTGASRIHRLLYFCERVTKTASSSSSSTTDDHDELVSTELIRQAYRWISETCLKEGRVVQYKKIFGNNTTPMSSSAELSTTNDDTTIVVNAMGSSSLSSGEASSSGGTSFSSPMIMTSTTTTTTTTNKVMKDLEYNAIWVEEHEHLYRRTVVVAESRLQVSQSQLHKESIRGAFLDLAAHCHKVGDYVPAWHALIRAKDYCTTRPQTTQVCLQLISVALAVGYTNSAAEYIHKLEHTLRNSRNNSTPSNNNNSNNNTTNTPAELDFILAQTALALVRILDGDFHKALEALLFVVQHEEMENAHKNNNSLVYWIATQDVFFYAALLCLTHGTLTQMATLSANPMLMEAAAPVLRFGLHPFLQANYGAAFRLLDYQFRNIVAVDPFLGPHLDTILIPTLQRKCFQHYWTAFSRVPLSTMAHDLGPRLVPSLPQLRKDWITLLWQYYQKGGGANSTTLHNSLPITADRDNIILSMEEALEDDSTATTTTTQSVDSMALHKTRLNLATDTLHREQDQDLLDTTQQKLSQLTTQVLDDSYALMIRLACQENDLMVLAAVDDWRQHGRPSTRQTGDIVLDDEEGQASASRLDQTHAINPEDLY